MFVLWAVFHSISHDKKISYTYLKKYIFLCISGFPTRALLLLVVCQSWRRISKKQLQILPFWRCWVSHRAVTTSQLWLCGCLLQLGDTYWSVQAEVAGLHLKADFIRPPQSAVRALVAPSSLSCVCSSRRKEAKMELKALGRLSLLFGRSSAQDVVIRCFTYTQTRIAGRSFRARHS